MAFLWLCPRFSCPGENYFNYNDNSEVLSDVQCTCTHDSKPCSVKNFHVTWLLCISFQVLREDSEEYPYCSQSIWANTFILRACHDLSVVSCCELKDWSSFFGMCVTVQCTGGSNACLARLHSPIQQQRWRHQGQCFTYRQWEWWCHSSTQIDLLSGEPLRYMYGTKWKVKSIVAISSKCIVPGHTELLLSAFTASFGQYVFLNCDHCVSGGLSSKYMYMLSVVHLIWCA